MKNILTIEEQYYVKALRIVAKMDKEMADEVEAAELAFTSSLFYRICSGLYDIVAIAFSIIIVIVMVAMFT